MPSSSPATPSATSPPPSCVVWSDDLLFASRITATGRAAGVSVRQAGTLKTLFRLVDEQVPDAVILDLDLAHPDLAKVLDHLRAAGVARLIGYGSHVEATRLKAARELGVTAMPRSQFAERLEAGLVGWVEGRDESV